MTFETIAALIIIILALAAGAGPILGPMRTRVIEMARRVEDLEKERRNLTDYKEQTIEQITRLVEQVGAVIAELAATKLLRDEQFTSINAKIDKEIHGQSDTREKAYQALQAALDKLDVKFLRNDETIRSALEKLAAMEVDLKHMQGDRFNRKE